MISSSSPSQDSVRTWDSDGPVRLHHWSSWPLKPSSGFHWHLYVQKTFQAAHGAKKLTNWHLLDQCKVAWSPWLIWHTGCLMFSFPFSRWHIDWAIKRVLEIGGSPDYWAFNYIFSYTVQDEVSNFITCTLSNANPTTNSFISFGWKLVIIRMEVHRLTSMKGQ